MVKKTNVSRVKRAIGLYEGFALLAMNTAAVFIALNLISLVILGFVETKPGSLSFGMELLEQKHVLVAPGSSFNTEYRDHFRITTLPDEDTLAEVFQRIDEVLRHMASRPPKLETA